MPEHTETRFLKPSALERGLNRAFGTLVGLGFGLQRNYLLQVRGRQTRRMYSTPVNLLETGGRLFLVCPRGRTQWVRNADAHGWVLLKRGRRVRKFLINAVSDEHKPAILKEYLDRFKTTAGEVCFPPPGCPSPSAPQRFVPAFRTRGIPVWRRLRRKWPPTAI